MKLPFSEAQVINDSMAYLLRSLKVDDIKVRRRAKAKQRHYVVKCLDWVSCRGSAKGGDVDMGAAERGQ